MKLLIFKPKPDESEEILCKHLYINRSNLKKARRITSSFLIHDCGENYIALSPYVSGIYRWIFSGIYRWIVPNDAYSYKPLTVVTYED